MQLCCDIEIDVNGEGTFFVNKNILALYSGRLVKFVDKLSGKSKSLKIIFNDFPGGSKGFELIVKYCYNKGKINITPYNVLLLHFAANFMEMNKDRNGETSLTDQTSKYLERVSFFTWIELLSCLKQSQKLPPGLNDSRILQDILECLVRRILLPCVTTNRPSSTSSSDNSSIEFSSDISTESPRSFTSHTSWWFKDLNFISISFLEKMVKTMVSRNLDHVMISSFLFQYQKMKFLDSSRDEKNKIIETVINLLYLLDKNSISHKALLRLLHVCSKLETRNSCIKELESMIGYKLDEASLDDLLVPSHGKSYAFDINLVLRLLKHFLSERTILHELKKVTFLMDLYIVEVAPDPGLKPSKFIQLVTSLPRYARDSHDRLYNAIDLYLKVHKNLPEVDKIRLCCVLDIGKCSAESSLHISQNPNFPECYHRKKNENKDKFKDNELDLRKKAMKVGIQVKNVVSTTIIRETRSKGRSLPTFCR